MLLSNRAMHTSRRAVHASLPTKTAAATPSSRDFDDHGVAAPDHAFALIGVPVHHAITAVEGAGAEVGRTDSAALAVGIPLEALRAPGGRSDNSWLDDDCCADAGGLGEGVGGAGGA